jgi:hypothetical protein
MDRPDTDVWRERRPQEHTIRRLGDLLTELHRLLAEVLTSPHEDDLPLPEEEMRAVERLLLLVSTKRMWAGLPRRQESGTRGEAPSHERHGHP